MRANKKGFTLVELLAVMAIIAVIGMIAIPNVISLMDNNKKDQMINDAQRLISLHKNYVLANREFRNGSETKLKAKMSALDPNGSISPDPDGGDYNTESSYVEYNKNSGYCVYLVGSKRTIKTETNTCVREENLTRSSVKDN